MTRGPIVVAGSLAQRPGYGGHAWVFLQYLLGFRRLGYEVLFLDWLDQTMCVNDAGKPCRVEDSIQLRGLQGVMADHGLDNAWSLNYNQGERTLGRSRADVMAAASRAELLINVMGFLSDWEILERPKRRVFLDIDPGFGQMWQDLGLAAVFGGHDAYVTIGENIGRPDCAIPTCGIHWITTPQPVVLERWPLASLESHRGFTSIASWRGPFAPVEYRGRTYGLRVHEFRKFMGLPRACGERFEVALDIHAAEVNDLALLRQNGWSLVGPDDAAGTPLRYQRYIRESKAEFMVAKNLYVDTRSGWISDRSICYLASGRPVLAQETGFSENHPAGEGLMAFSTFDEAQTGVEEICRNYEKHSRAARRVAEKKFDSDKVLRRLLEQVL